MGTNDLQRRRRYRCRMTRFVLCAALVASSSLAVAQPKPAPAPAVMPTVGSTLAINGADGWPTLLWMYDNPNPKDAAGKVVIHWFCAPKVAACTDDLARITTLKETTSNTYVIAYVNGTKPQAQKLDPIRGSEGVGRGTVAFGPATPKWFKGLGITGPVSIIVDVDNKVQLVTTGSQPAELDARDAKVKALIAGIKLHTTALTGPKTVKAGEKFELGMSVTLASWLVYSKKPGTNYEWKAMLPRDVKCDNTALKGDQLKADGQMLAIKMTCSGPHGSYEATGQIQFGYDVPSGATGIGADGGKWKFEITN
jgi:hypothetical protein